MEERPEAMGECCAASHVTGPYNARKAAGINAAGTGSSSSTPGPRDHGTGTGGRQEDDAGRPEGRPEGCRDR